MKQRKLHIQTYHGIRLEFKIQDLWIGVYWSGHETLGRFDIWICVIPCFPIHYWRFKEVTLGEFLP